MSGIYALKPWFVRGLRTVEDILAGHQVSPNSITLAALLISAVAGAAVIAGQGQPLVWLTILPLGIARLALNALDGSVARRTERTTPLGTALNEIGDRACDFALFAPLIVVVPPWLAVGALCSMMLASTSGVMAQVVTGTRATSGPMGKADRVIVVGMAAGIAAVISSTTPLALALVVVTVGCAVTTVLRLDRLRRTSDVRR